jgi:hypothetical protein
VVDGVYLQLMVGPVGPVPVPASVLNALTTVKVTTSADKASGFELNFTLAKNSPLLSLFLLASGASIPLLRVVIAVTIAGTTTVLMDGVVTHQQVSPGHDAGDGTLTIMGSDLSAAMDYIDFSGFPFPAMPDVARVALILAKYAFLGVVPLVIPSILFDVPNPLERIPRQLGTDLAYIKSLADAVGYVFYVEPGPTPGKSVGYWGPQIKIGDPQPALNVDLDAQSNVESVSFQWNAEKAELPIVFIQEPNTNVPIPIPVPAITPLNPPLGLIPPIPRRIRPVNTSAKLSPVQAALIGVAKASRSADVLTAQGTLDVVRYGRPLKARGLVGLRGVGQAFDGLYYVSSVTHSLQQGSYKQSFSLTRNGLISTLPRVSA